MKELTGNNTLESYDVKNNDRLVLIVSVTF